MIETLKEALAALPPANDGDTCHIPPDWKPSPEAIRALPRPLRDYIHELHTRTDPALDLQLIQHQRDLIEQLTAELQGQLRD